MFVDGLAAAPRYQIKIRKWCFIMLECEFEGTGHESRRI